MLRRALTAASILLAGAAALMLGFAIAGPGSGAGAVPNAASTTSSCLGIPCSSTTAPTVPLTTAPATTSPPQTAPPTTRAPVTQTRPPATKVPGTTVPAPTTTASTLPSIGGNLPVTPSTVPFTTKQQSSHVSPVFAALSGVGFFLALVIVMVRFITSRPYR